MGINSIDALLGKSFVCEKCGRTHAMDTRKQFVGEEAWLALRDDRASLGLTGKGLLVCDQATYEAAGKELLKKLDDPNISIYIFTDDKLHADRMSIGRLLIAMADKPDYLIACGSGTITDIVRYCAYITDKNFLVYATAASVDGFASGSTPMIVDGFKITYPGKAPLGIYADTHVLARAPRAMTAAGFGDVLAKIIAVIDWRLAYAVEGEAFCPYICEMVEEAVDECISMAGDLATSDSDACGRLMKSLSLTGIAMQMMTTTRPASGGEHQISHLLEMNDIRLDKEGSLHGDKVGIGTLICLYIYKDLFKGKSMPGQGTHLTAKDWEVEVRRVYGPLADRAIAINESYPPTGQIWEEQKEKIRKTLEDFGYDYLDKYWNRIGQLAEMITAMGGPVTSTQLGYSEQELYDAIAFSKEVRPKFTILRIAERFGHLYKLAAKISEDPTIVFR